MPHTTQVIKLQTGCYWPNPPFITHAVGRLSRPAVDIEHAITFRVAAAFPYPAAPKMWSECGSFTVLVNMAPKARFDRPGTAFTVMTPNIPFFGITSATARARHKNTAPTRLATHYGSEPVVDGYGYHTILDRI